MEDKPFLEHLEDFRVMIIRIVVTLVITTVLSFTFAGKVMDFLRMPVDKVWGMHEEQRLPEGVNVEAWIGAKRLAHAIAGDGMNPEAKRALAAEFSPETRRLAECVPYLEAAKLLPESRREEWLQQVVPAGNNRQTCLELLKSGVDLELDPKGSLKMMGAFQPTEAFMLSMKLAFYSGIVIGFPFLLYFLLQFVLPGLEQRERKMLWPALAVSFGLFLAGVSFAYFLVLPKVLTFFFEYGLELGILNEWRIGYYLSFVTQFVLLFGLAFELPVLVMILVKLGLLNYRLMASTRSYAIVGIMVLAAVLTPTPDIVTMLLMAVPMYFLYEVCVLLAWFDMRKQARLAERSYGIDE